MLIHKLRQVYLISILGRLNLGCFSVAQTAPNAQLNTPRTYHRRVIFILATYIFLFLLLQLHFLIVFVLQLAEDGDELEVYLVGGALGYVEGEREHIERIPVDRLVVFAHVEEKGEFVG